MKFKIFPLFITAAFAVNNLFAGGFQINEHGAKAMAMAGAFTAVANDASAVYFNSAGITQLMGTHISAGTTLIMPKASFRGPSPSVTEYDMEDQLFTPSNFYITHQFSDDLFVGFGFNNPYGLGTKWDENWVGRYLAIDTEIRTFNFNPVVAYKLMDNLSISAGVTYSLADVKIERKSSLAPFAGEAYVKLDGDANAIGYSAALLYKLTDALSFGISFHSEYKYDFEGTAKTTGPAQVQSQLPNGDVTAPLTAPMNLVFGAACQVMPELLIAADFQYIGWSSYDVLKVDFNDPQFEDLAAERNYENTFIARLGAEYKLTDKFALRGGFLFDNNPVKDEYVDPTLPDADRLGFNIGLGYDLTENLTIDLAYLFLRFNERTITTSKESYSSEGFAPFNGTYNSTANLFGVNFSYKF